ncbi:MAG: flagellar biosynthesis protein FlaG [Desulfobacter postgatei]|uniref:Flagellar biosynthesis protein FlaG n=1 Tax=Desulfobacter postgatei TaxID=2293 RepID=A0A2G6MT14_9BACT|nr:MAG: flagellar biosynthesis protein FlaG [Desulfobacter postgatei]
MNITGNAITNIDRPETSIKVQNTVSDAVSADITKLSKLAQAASSSTITKRAENQASEQKSEETGNQAKLTRKDVVDMVEALGEFANTVQTKLNFTIDDDTEDVVVKIMDKETDEVIKQFPAEELLDLREKMQDLSGLLFTTDV